MTRFDNPPTQRLVGGDAWKSYPVRPTASDSGWRDGLGKPELAFVEALDETREVWNEASEEVDADVARALVRWPEPWWWHKVAGGVLATTGIVAAVVGVAAFATQADPVAVTTDSVVSFVLACLPPLSTAASALLRTRAAGLGHTGRRWRIFLFATAIALTLATFGMAREEWSTPAVWTFLPMAAVLGMAAATGWRFSRPSER